MVRVRRAPPPISVVLSVDDRRRVADLFIVLIAVNRRVGSKRSAKRKTRSSRYEQKEKGLLIFNRQQALLILSTNFF